jgi:hypothetical protein
MIKKKFLSVTIYLIVFSQPIFSQVNNTGIVYNTGNVFITGYKINNGTLFNSGSIYIGGDVTNNGATNYDGGTIIFNGSSTQTLTGSNTFSTTSVIFNNATGININKCLSINTLATFNSGLVTTPTGSIEPIEFNTIASHTNTSNSSHVNGFVRKLGAGSFTYPVGDASVYEKVDVNPTSNTSGIVVKYFPTDAGTAPFGTTGTDPIPLQYYNALEYWDIAPVSSATGNVTVYWDGYNDGAIGSVSDLKVAHKTGGQWLDEGTTGSGLVSAGSVISNAISVWSPFTLGSISSNSPLPITLTSFTADAINCKGIKVNWHTASEINFNHYELQYSVDALNFNTLSGIAPKGNNSDYEYSFVPETKETIYFRLKIIDNDDTFSYSPIIYSNAICNDKTVKVYPNITHDIFTIQSNDNSIQTFTLYDAKGSLILTESFSNYKIIDMNDFDQGLYNLIIISSDGAKTDFKIIHSN